MSPLRRDAAPLRAGPVTTPPALRCSAVLLRGESVLLIHRTHGGHDDWVLPGGTPRSTESVGGCVRREVREETGLSVDVWRIAFVLDAVDHDNGLSTTDIVFTVRDLRPAAVPRNTEAHTRVAFVPLADLGRLHLRPPIGGHLGSLRHDATTRTAPYLGKPVAAGPTRAGHRLRPADHRTYDRGAAMSMLTITGCSALEILDSRGRPTLLVTLTVDRGIEVSAGVPSGKSTGTGEAAERRDGDLARYAGQGVREAVQTVNGEIADRLVGHGWDSQWEIDTTLVGLDGTDDLSRLGANAVVGVSMAAARAFSAVCRQPLWRWLNPDQVPARLPVPHFNVLNGGAHAPNSVEFQEFMVAPLGAPDLPSAVRAGVDVYVALRRLLADGGYATGLGDEGGFAPNLGVDEALRTLTTAIRAAGYLVGRDGVAIALDPAASGFRGPDGLYRVGGTELSSDDLIDWYTELVLTYPVWSIEDGLAEDDWDGWARLTERLGDRVQIMGDDLFVTNPAVIRDAIERTVGTSALIKLNQVGTVTQTLEAMEVCRKAGYTQMVSHRSGETTDAFIADLAVGSGCGQIKSGAPARGERVAKYNRLLAIADQHPDLPYGIG